MPPPRTADSDAPVPPLIGVVMGSSSDWPTMVRAVEILTEFGVPHEARVLSAHRMPDAMFTYAEEASLVPPGYDAITRWLAALRERDSWRATERMKREALAAYGIDLSTRRAPVERGSLDAAERGG